MIKTESCVGEGMRVTEGKSETRLEKQKEGIKVEEEEKSSMLHCGGHVRSREMLLSLIPSSSK